MKRWYKEKPELFIKIPRNRPGPDIYLWHQDSGLVYVIVREPYGLELVTAINDKYWIARNIPTQSGQHLKYAVSV